MRLIQKSKKKGLENYIKEKNISIYQQVEITIDTPSDEKKYVRLFKKLSIFIYSFNI